MIQRILISSTSSCLPFAYCSAAFPFRHYPPLLSQVASQQCPGRVPGCPCRLWRWCSGRMRPVRWHTAWPPHRGSHPPSPGPLCSQLWPKLHRMHLTHIFWAVGLQFCDPCLESLEGGPAGDVVHHQGDPAILVVDPGDGFVLFLPGSVPELELHPASLRHLRLLEVDRPQRGLQALVELVVDEADGEAALADAHGANHDHLRRHLRLHD